MTEPPVHYLPPPLEVRPRRAGKTARRDHLKLEVANQDGWTDDPALVTCDVCRDHLRAEA